MSIALILIMQGGLAETRKPRVRTRIVELPTALDPDPWTGEPGRWVGWPLAFGPARVRAAIVVQANRYRDGSLRTQSFGVGPR